MRYLNQTIDYFKPAKDPILSYPQDDYRLVQEAAWFSNTFYADINHTEVIGTMRVPISELPGYEIDGCGRGQLQVSVDWAGLPSGVHPYLVEADSSNVIKENPLKLMERQTM